MSTAQKKSLVWNFFTRDREKNLVICNTCKNTWPYLGTTTNSRFHLRDNHPRVHTELETLEKVQKAGKEK